jgi:hypothetical protein
VLFVVHTQVFALNASAPAGRYFAVRFHGKRQQQWEGDPYKRLTIKQLI